MAGEDGAPVAGAQEAVMEQGKRKREGDDVAEGEVVAPEAAVKKLKASEEETAGEVAGDEVAEEKDGEKEETTTEEVKLGGKVFKTGVDLFSYFYTFLQKWPMNVDVNKYEALVLKDLLSKGHTDAPGKIGAGIHSFQVRNHPNWRSRCYYIIRLDGSIDDFSYRKCCDHILPLPPQYVADGGKVRIDMLDLGNVWQDDKRQGSGGRQQQHRGGGRAGRGGFRGGSGRHRGGRGGRGRGRW